MIDCPRCGREVLAPEKTRFCAACNHPFLNTLPLPRPALGFFGKVPWEDMEERGFFRALFFTLKECLFAPGIFFQRVAASHNPYPAWLYALVLGSIGTVFSHIWTIIPAWFSVPVMQWSKGFSANDLVLTPLTVTAVVVCAAAYFHALLLVARGTRQKFAATFTIICYAQSTAIFQVVPGLGNLLSALWFLYLLAIGFNKVHGISKSKAMLIIVLPPVVLALCAAFAAALFLGLGLFMNDTGKDLLRFLRYL